MTVIDLSKTNEKNADLSLKLRADSGYSSDATGYRVSANQWSAIIAICEDGEMGQALIALHVDKLGVVLA